MERAKDIYSTNWFSTVTAAQMCRVTPPPPDSNPIAIPRAIFDELVRIAEAASRLKHLARSPAEMVIHRQEGSFSVTVFDPLTAPYTVNEQSLLGALAAAASRLDEVIQDLIR